MASVWCVSADTALIWSCSAVPPGCSSPTPSPGAPPRRSVAEKEHTQARRDPMHEFPPRSPLGRARELTHTPPHRAQGHTPWSSTPLPGALSSAAPASTLARRSKPPRSPTDFRFPRTRGAAEGAGVRQGDLSGSDTHAGTERAPSGRKGPYTLGMPVAAAYPAASKFKDCGTMTGADAGALVDEQT